MGSTGFGPLVTVSATYGTGGSVIAPRLAETLGLPFIDRLISADMSQDAARQERVSERQQSSASGASDPLGGPGAAERSQEGLSEGEQATTPAGRFLSYFARAASVGAMMAPDTDLEDDESIRQRTEEGLRDLAAGAPGVLLGRAGAVVLASRPRAFHVRLDGPVERRVAWAAEHEGLGLDAAKRRQHETDRARTQFVKRLFRVDPAEARLYHLLIDPTVLGIEPTLQLLVTASQAFFAANPGG
jgi:cytidylate kinase